MRGGGGYHTLTPLLAHTSEHNVIINILKHTKGIKTKQNHKLKNAAAFYLPSSNCLLHSSYKWILLGIIGDRQKGENELYWLQRK